MYVKAQIMRSTGSEAIIDAHGIDRIFDVSKLPSLVCKD